MTFTIPTKRANVNLDGAHWDTELHGEIAEEHRGSQFNRRCLRMNTDKHRCLWKPDLWNPGPFGHVAWIYLLRAESHDLNGSWIWTSSTSLGSRERSS